MTENSRRKLLKSLSVTTGAIVAGKSLPESWVKPVVDSVVLPAHAATSCTPCLDAATYCEGPGISSLRVAVAIDGTVTVTHLRGVLTDNVDACAGGAFSVVFVSAVQGDVTVSGSIPCGVTASLSVVVTDGQGTNNATLEKGLCT